MADLSDEERARRSRTMRALVATGWIDPKAAAARSVEARRERSRSASELTNKLVEQNAAAISQRLRQILATGSDAQALRASEALLRLGLRSEGTDLQERRTQVAEAQVSPENRAEVLERLAHALTGGSAAGSLLRRQLDQAVDAEADEVLADDA